MKTVKKNIKYFAFLAMLVLVAIVIFVLFYNVKPTKVSEPKPSFYAYFNKCLLDMRDNGTFSFFFDVKIRENKTKLPSELFFKINKIYNLEKYEIIKEYKLEKIYSANETISNVSFIIDNVYKDYMYLPSQNFNFQVFYCEFTDQQKDYMKNNNISIFNVLNEYCIWIYDYEMLNAGNYIHVVGQHPGEQCEVIQRQQSA